MTRGGIPIGKLFGISLRLNYSWFIIFALVTWALAAGYFPATFPGWDLGTRISLGIVTSLLFFASVLAHELMHSIVAQASGIPVQSITLFVFGGVSQITKEPNKPSIEFRMAVAGPLTSLVLGGVFWAIRAGFTNGPLQIEAIAFWLGWINIALGVFNLIPGFPLDGGRVLRSIIWWRTQNLRTATRIASGIGRGIGYFFIFVGIATIFMGQWFNGLWLALIGWFLESAASGSYRQLALDEILKGHTVKEVMSQDCLMVGPDMSIEKLVHEQILTSGRRCFPVTTGDRVLGLVTVHNVRAVPRNLWAIKTVAEIMTPFESLKWVRPEEELSNALRLLAQEDINQLPVVKDSKVVGVLARDNLISFINIRSELGG